MRVPERLVPLVEQGVIHEVVRPLMAGKEAQVFLVAAAGQLRVAKVYKEANERSFRQRADYTEGRKVRNSRQQRAMDKRSKYGKEQIEAEWRSAEVDAIYRLRAAGVRVPEPFDYVDGVLVMELVADERGEPAPRLADLSFERKEARELFDLLVTEVSKMLLAGVVHGDLSDFNVLMGARGPVIIDFPQATDSAHNNLARKLLIRDVDNLTSFLARFAPELKGRPYGREMWDLYTRNELRADTVLTGKARAEPSRKANTNSLLAELDELAREARRKREALGLPMRPARKPKFQPSGRASPVLDTVDAPAQAPRNGQPQRGKGPAGKGPAGKAHGSANQAQGGKGSPPAKKPADPFDDLDRLLLVEDD